MSGRTTKGSRWLRTTLVQVAFRHRPGRGLLRPTVSNRGPARGVLGRIERHLPAHPPYPARSDRPRA